MELIGKHTKLNVNGKTILGKIVDETKNTIKVKSGNKTITIMKDSQELVVNGQKIQTENKKPSEKGKKQ